MTSSLFPTEAYSYGRNMDIMLNILRINILFLLCTCLRNAKMEEIVNDDSLYPDKEAGNVNDISSQLLENRLGDQLNGIFSNGRNRLWFNENGQAEMHYCFGKSTDVDLSIVKEAFQQVAEMWGRKTCVRFTNVAPEQCSKPEYLKHGVIHIDTFLYKCCSSDFGNRYNWLQGNQTSCQKMCIDPREQRCNKIDIRGLISYSLGLLSPMNRPDRDDVIAFHPEEMDITMWPPIPYNAIQRWRNMHKCPMSQPMVTPPIPYDFLSMRHPLTSQYATKFAESGVVVSRDRTKQYLLEHRFPACPDISHFDIYQIIKAYQCDKKFAEECLKSKGSIPKCLNYGYLKRDCTCACSKYYTGERCETSTGAPDYCFDNVWFLNITNIDNSTLYDTDTLGMEVRPVEAPGPDFILNRDIHKEVNAFQFLTVTAESLDPLKHISATLSFAKVQRMIDTINEYQDKVIEAVVVLECGTYYNGFALNWGTSRNNHVRIWCFSSFFLNEPYPVVLRSRVPRTFDMFVRSGIGFYFQDPSLSVESLLFQMEVSSFSVMNVTDSRLAPTSTNTTNGTSSNGGDEDITELKSWAKALLATANPKGVISAGIMGIVLLVGITLVGCCSWYCGRGERDEVVLLDTFGDSSDDGDGSDSD